MAHEQLAFQLGEVSQLNRPAPEGIKAARQHVWFHHHDADGFVTIAKKEKGVYLQYHYRPEELAEKLSNWLGEDVYFSQNTFYRPQRRIDTIRQLRSLYVDLDTQKLGLNNDWVLGKLELEMFRTEIPEPNIILHSGRGLVLIWRIEPVPVKALPLWQVIENYLVSSLSHVGSDASASDAARIFRVAGSKNSKNGAIVRAEFLHNAEYSLRLIASDYLPELKPSKKRSWSKKGSIQYLFNLYSLYKARLDDLLTLCELRQWDMIGHREKTLFLYRYWSSCFTNDPDAALKDMLALNDRFASPLVERTVLRATRSAEKAYHAKSNREANEIARKRGYPAAGYNYSNNKLIEVLDITEDEQRYLKTIINKKEKQYRNTKKKEEIRRENGSIPRGEYLSQVEKRRKKAESLRAKGHTYQDIANTLDVSISTIKRYLGKNSLSK